MLDYNSIVKSVVSGSSGGMSKSASRNLYEWEVSAGLKSGTRARLADGRLGMLTAPFPGCRGHGDWCGVFLDDGTEENIRPTQVAATFDKAFGWRPYGSRTAAEFDQGAEDAEGAEDAGAGRTVTYTVEFQGHGTDNMSATMKKNAPDGEETASTNDHSMASNLLSSLVEFEANAAAASAEEGWPTWAEQVAGAPAPGAWATADPAPDDLGATGENR